MHKKLFALILAFILLSSLALPGSAAVPDELLASDASLPLSEEKAYCNATLEDEFADDRVVVVLSNKASTSLRTYTTADFEGIGCTKVQNLTQYTTELVNAKLRGETAELQKAAEPDVITFAEFKEVDTKTFRQILCLTLDKADKQNVLDVIDILMKHPDVLSAEPDYVIKAASTNQPDTYRGQQWAIDKIQLPAAWNYSTGSSTVRVGVIDSGIDGKHTELRYKINYLLSRDYIPGRDITPNSVDEVIDETGHGTQVAGIIGAAVNNGEGISGICHNVELISLRVLNDRDYGYITWFIQAIDYAELKKIPILNMSISWSSIDYTENEHAAFCASLEQYTGLLICAAGNSNVDIDAPADNAIYPGVIGYDNLIVVGASTNTDTKVGSSNWGAESVDLFAPGYLIYTCHPQGLSAGVATPISNGYVSAGATSMAAPHVAGVTALVLAKYPTLSAMQIKEKILWSVDPVIVFYNQCVTGGRLNAYKAVHPHSFHHYSNTVTHHRSVCACGATYLKGAHTYEQVGPRLYQCTVCGYENEWLP